MATQIYEFYFCGAVTFLDNEKNVKTKITRLARFCFTLLQNFRQSEPKAALNLYVNIHIKDQCISY